MTAITAGQFVDNPGRKAGLRRWKAFGDSKKSVYEPKHRAERVGILERVPRPHMREDVLERLGRGDEAKGRRIANLLGGTAVFITAVMQVGMVDWDSAHERMSEHAATVEQSVQEAVHDTQQNITDAFDR